MSGTWYFASKYSYHNKKIIVIYALLISFFWHLLWGILFRVDLNPKDLKIANITRTVFLGDFLDRVHLRESLTTSKSQTANKVIAFIEKSYNNPNILPEKMYFEEIKQKDFSTKVVDFDKTKAESIFLRYPQIPAVTSKISDVELEGPLKMRDIVFMPPKPKVPQWMEDKGQFNVKYKLIVDRYGRVVFVEQLSSSSYLEIDLLAIKYLKKWRFSGLNQTREDNLQWGTIVVKLDSLDDND